jgi:histidinol-phosphate aminotransferase
MKFVNKYLRNLLPYKVASHKIWEVDNFNRKNILKLDWNESTIPPSPLVKETLMKIVAQEDIYSLYPSTYNEHLLQLLSNYTNLPKNNLQYFASSDSLHEYLVRMYVGVGDPILVIGPTYDNFRLTCESQGGQVSFFNYDENFTLDFDQLNVTISILTPSLIYICNPNNPTGNSIDIRQIKILLEKYPDTLVLLDEAYFEFSRLTMAKYVLEYDNLFISRTFSKAFGLANFRIGYLISSTENINQISKIRNPKNVTTFAQEAAISALSDIDYMNKYVDEVNLAKSFFKNQLEQYPFIKYVYPSESNFLLIAFVSYDFKINFFNHLNRNNIFVRNLSHSKLLDNCLRITIGTLNQMKLVLEVIKDFNKKSNESNYTRS